METTSEDGRSAPALAMTRPVVDFPPGFAGATTFCLGASARHAPGAGHIA